MFGRHRPKGCRHVRVKGPGKKSLLESVLRQAPHKDKKTKGFGMNCKGGGKFG